MCSTLILASNSCYVDNFGNIFNVLSKGLIMGIILGTTVGILLLFVKKH